MDIYFEKLKDLEEKLGQKGKIQKDNEKSIKKQNQESFELKWALYKKFSPIIKNLLTPLIQALSNVYPSVKFRPSVFARKDDGCLTVYWTIDFCITSNHTTYFTVELPNSQEFFEISRGKYEDHDSKFEMEVKATEECLKEGLKTVFLDYIEEIIP